MDISQPKGFWPLVMTSFWERFSFYGFRSFLSIYLAEKMLISDEMIFETYGALMALMYISPLIGGYLGDRYLGARQGTLLGLFLVAIAQFLMCFLPSQYFDWGLIFLVTGVGYFKPNMAAGLSGFYREGDPRRERGFTYYFMMVNVGALLAPLCGMCAQNPELIWGAMHIFSEKTSTVKAFSFLGYSFGLDGLQWKCGFFIAGFVAFLGALIFAFGSKSKARKSFSLLPWVRSFLILLFFLGISALFFYLLRDPVLAKFTILGTAIISMGAWIFMGKGMPPGRKKALWIGVVFILYHVLFVAVSEQAGSSWSLFVHRNVNRFWLGREIPASFFQGIIPLFVVLTGPLVSLFWEKLSGKQDLIPFTQVPLKFAASMLLMGGSLFLLEGGCSFATGEGIVSVSWFVGASLLVAVGELCIFPVGLSFVMQIAPQNLQGSVSAIWFISRAFAYYLGTLISKEFFVIPGKGNVLNALDSLGVYSSAFGTLGWLCIGSGLLFLLITPFLSKCLKGALASKS